MALEPYNWNIIIVGYWNRAILTPQGIATRLFGLSPETPIEIEVPIDTLGPFRVTHDQMTVSVQLNRLVIEPAQCEFQELQRAKEIARQSIDGLPETPLDAVGINVRYRSQEPNDALIAILANQWDNDISDQDFQIRGRNISRSLDWNDGKINVSVSQTDAESKVVINIERTSKVKDDHLAWLDRDIDKIREVVRQIAIQTLHIQEEDIPNE